MNEPTLSPTPEDLAMDALRHLVRRITADPRLAWLIGPGSETYERAMLALATTFSDGGAELRRQVETNLKTTPWPTGEAEGACQAPTFAARDVLAERQRQISVKGWTPEHDDMHRGSDLAMAAACYADPQAPEGICPGRWPFLADSWKPRDHRSNLIRAGALILAEIERLDRGADRG